MKWRPHLHGLGWAKPGHRESTEKRWLPLAEAGAAASLLLDSEMADLSLLDALAAEFDLQEIDGSIIVPWAALDFLDEERRRLLELPPTVEPAVQLMEFGASSLPRYRIESRIADGEQGRVGRTHGAVAVDDRILGVLPSAWTEALKIADGIAKTPPGEQRTESLFALARASKEFGWTIPDSLASMVEVERWRIAATTVSAQEVTLGVGWPAAELDHLDAQAVCAVAENSGLATERVAGKWVRIRVSKDARAAVRTGTKRTLTGQAIPQFVANPEAILGDVADAFDLDDYSARVRGLLPAVYRSRPYIRAEPSGMDWFDVEVGADLEELSPDGGATAVDCEPPKLTTKQWRAAVEQAVAEGADYALVDEHWVHVENAAEALENLRRVDAACVGGRVHATNLRSILQIYENIEDLEYAEDVSKGPLSLPKVALPNWFAIPLKEHQELGLRWLHAHYTTGTGAILADEMGVGKTAQLLALLCVVRGDGPSLVVAPAAVVAQWPDEAARFAPGLKVAIIERASEFEARRAVPGTVWVISYDALRRGQQWLARIAWCVVACDEAQKVKNKTAQITHVVKALKARFRVAMSGTPVENGLGELWNLFDLVRPSLLGCYRDFAVDFEAPILRGPGGKEALDRLTRVTSPFILRRLKADHIPGLPGLQLHVVQVQCTPEQRSLIATKVADLKASGGQGIFLAYANWVQRCLFDPALVGGGLQGHAPKMAKVLEIIDSAWCIGERTIVVAEQLDVQERLARALLHRYGTAPYVINGSVDTDERLRRVKAFSQHPCPALILSPKAGGVGLNITAANHVILPTRMFNPAPEDQSIARAHRMGQQRDVHVYVLTASDERPTFDQKLHELLSKKRELAASTLYPIEKLGISEKELATALVGDWEA